MAIQERKKETDLEKRLKVLNRQLYGRQEEAKAPTQETLSQKPSYSLSENSLPLNSHKNLSAKESEVLYLRQDLLKIFILSSLAIAAQFSLYLALTKQLVKLPIIF